MTASRIVCRCRRLRWLSWAAQRGSAFLTTSTKPQRISENYQKSPLPDDAMSGIRDQITTNIRFNSVVQTGVPGFIPRPV
jgi:diketogulonate reductase-like aldo/keto reductase